MKITIPELSLVALVGVSGSGKSTFARRHFKPTEVLSSDFCRGLVSDDENDQTVTKDAFEVLHFIVRKRLALGKLVVVDATNVQQESRKAYVQLAREFHCIPVAIVLNLPERIAHDRNRGRPERTFGPHVIHQQRDHTPVPQPEWLNRTINIDTGCVFGGSLTALRYPEKELISVPARQAYAESKRPLAAPADTQGTLSAQQQQDDLLDISDVSGKRIITTRLHRTVTIREENAAAALEVMSRFAANPKWLIYLPPTMSPSDTSREPGLLEHPTEAFGYYRSEGIAQVICEEKHMGSRAIVVVCRNPESARKRFGVTSGETGICYTRTGRRFFDDTALESDFLVRIREATTQAGLWDELNTDWLCLDCELMPWSAKAQALIQEQYAPVGASASAMLTASASRLAQATARGLDVRALEARTQSRGEMASRYIEAYRHYCWPVRSVADLKLAPFHLMASEGHVYVEKPHGWHLETLSRLAGGIITATQHLVVDLADEASIAAGVRSWTELTQSGGEGMVVKPLEFVAKGRRGLVQPAVKCRGPEYLRIIYGPEYTAEENLERLRTRSLQTKRSLALREFALGVEALESFTNREPLRRVHECVFGVLALESEPVDPRL